MLASTDRNSFRLALADLWEGVNSLHLWPMLGWLEIRQRYRRSILGPFWLTLSTGVLIGAMGPLYGRLLGQDLAGYFPYLAISLILWQFISGMINESCVAFVAAESYIKQTRLPLTVHVLRVVWRNLIIFAHNVVIVVLVLLFYPPTIGWELLTVPLGCLLVAVNGVWFGILLGLLSARFRDIPQIIMSITQVAFFLTPILWKREMVGRYSWSVDVNPIYHFLEIVRGPLIGQPATATTWLTVASITVVGYAVALVLFSRFRSRIPYWV